jgi:hypothetical protein
VAGPGAAARRGGSGGRCGRDSGAAAGASV